MHEAEDEDLRNYKNLSQFFRRQLKPDARLLDISSPLVKYKDIGEKYKDMGEKYKDMGEKYKDMGESFQDYS